MIQVLFLCLWTLLGCAEPEARYDLRAAEGGLEVVATVPMDRVRLLDPEGGVLLDHSPPVPMTRIWLPAQESPGETLKVLVADRELPWVMGPTSPWVASLEAPVGRTGTVLEDGASVEVGSTDGMLTAALVVEARRTVALTLDGAAVGEMSAGPGERVLRTLEVGPEPQRVVISGGGRTVAFTVTAHQRSLEEARERLEVVDLRMPTDAAGHVDRARPPDRVSLPSPWWRALLRRTGLGYRARDDQAPWAWQAVTLRNSGAEPEDVLLRASVVDERGRAAPAFRAWLRESDADRVQVALRVPPGSEAVAQLPVFAAGSELPDNAVFTRRVEVLPLGATTPLHVVERPLWVSRGSSWASGWLAVALLAAALGWGQLLLGGRRFLSALPTADLVTIGLFGSVTWVVGTVLQVAGLGLSALLGPFTPLLTGLVDDTFRACLLGTLVALIPRPGTAALATTVGFVMRGLTTGSFHPVDLLYLGSAVFWLETWLWVAGCTRGEAWRDRALETWARLSLGLGLANLCAVASALVVSVVFYRLYFAAWYVGLILALPGFLYVVLGCVPAVGFQRALRRVEG